MNGPKASPQDKEAGRHFDGPAPTRAADDLTGKLLDLKWAYNAKPDLLVISRRQLVFVEAKLESGIDYTMDGYNQARISRTIPRLMHLVSDFVVDTQHEVDFTGITFISKKQEKDPQDAAPLPTILWSEIASFAQGSRQLDTFTSQGLLQFAERAGSGEFETN